MGLEPNVVSRTGDQAETVIDPSMKTLSDRHYASTDPNRKLPGYLDEYERLFAPLRNSPVRLLELGVRDGASMRMWTNYFPNATIVGLDIDKRPEGFPQDDRVRFVQGSQSDPAMLDQCLALAGGSFDIIIDDASHIGSVSAASFAHLFPTALKPGGFYVIEDICTAFLPDFPDSEPYDPREVGNPGDARSNFPGHQTGMVGFVKQILDHVMAPVVIGSYSKYAVQRMHVLPNIVFLQKAGA